MEFKSKSNKQKEMSMDEFISYLMICRNVLHAMHLKITGQGSYATHKALNELYDSIVDSVDEIAEAYQGYYGKLLTLKFETGNEYLNYKPVDYVEEILKHVEHCKSKFQDNSMIVNEIDVLVKNLASAHYKLKFLS
jgi:DNA-binding ferritin-like protein